MIKVAITKNLPGGPEAQKRYIVKKIEESKSALIRPKVYCYGDVVSYSQRSGEIRFTHDAKDKCFVLESVDIAEVDKTVDLAAALFEQTLKEKKEG